MQYRNLSSGSSILINFAVLSRELQNKEIGVDYCNTNKFILPQQRSYKNEKELKEEFMAFFIRPSFKFGREHLQLLIDNEKIKIGSNNSLNIIDLSSTTFVWDQEYTNKRARQNYNHLLDKGEDNLGKYLNLSPYIENTIKIFNKFLEWKYKNYPDSVVPEGNENSEDISDKFNEWKDSPSETINIDKNCLTGDWALPNCCFKIFYVNEEKYLLFGHPYTKMIEHFKQKLNDISLIENYIKMRSKYSKEEEKTDLFEFTKLLKINSLFNLENFQEQSKYIFLNDDLKTRYGEKIIESINELLNLSLGRLGINISYNFKIFKFVEENKIDKLGHNIRDLKFHHINVLKETQKLIKNFMKKTFKLGETSDIFHNILCYFKYPVNSLTIHVNYIPPFSNFEEYAHIYDNIFKLSNIINILESGKEGTDVMKNLDLSVSFSPGSMPFRDPYEDEIIKKSENLEILSRYSQHLPQKGGNFQYPSKATDYFGNNFEGCKVVYVHTDRRYTSHCIIKKMNKYYYMRIISRLKDLQEFFIEGQYEITHYYCCSEQKIGNGDDIKCNGVNIIKNKPIFFIEYVSRILTSLDINYDIIYDYDKKKYETKKLHLNRYFQDFKVLLPFLSIDLFSENDNFNSEINFKDNHLVLYPKLLPKLILSFLEQEKKTDREPFITQRQREYCKKWINHKNYYILFTGSKYSTLDRGEKENLDKILNGWIVPQNLVDKVREIMVKYESDKVNLFNKLDEDFYKDKNTITNLLQCNQDIYDLIYLAKKWYMHEYKFDEYGNYIGDEVMTKKMYIYANLYSAPSFGSLHIKFIQSGNYQGSSVGTERFGRSYFLPLESFKRYVDINKYFPNLFKEFNNSFLPFYTLIHYYMSKTKINDTITFVGGKFNHKNRRIFRKLKKSKRISKRSNKRSSNRNGRKYSRKIKKSRNRKSKLKRKNINKKSNRKSKRKRNIYN